MAVERPTTHPTEHGARLGRLASAMGVRALVARINPRRADEMRLEREAAPVVSPVTWANVDDAVEQAIATFVPIASQIHGIVRVDAKSSGPTVHFLVIVEGPWDHAIESIESSLFPLAKAGSLPPFDYDVRQGGAPSEPGYVQVHPA